MFMFLRGFFASVAGCVRSLEQPLVGTLWHHFLHELGLCYGTAPLLVKLVHYCQGVLVAYEEATRSAELNDFVSSYLAIGVQVTDLESRGKVEERILFDSLPQLFCKHLHSEVGPPQFFQVEQSQRHEEILRMEGTIEVRPVYRVPGIDYLRKLNVKWNEHFTELIVMQPSILVFVVPLEK